MMENKEKTTRLDGQKEILEALRQEVQKLCTVDDKVEIQEMVKNNNVVKLGMTIQEQGKPVSPLIYLEPYLRSLNEGTAIEETAQSIYAVHRKCRGQELAAANEFFQAELVKEKVIYQRVNLEKNREILETMPYRVIGEDLAAVFAVLWEKDDTGIMTIKIKQEHMRYWQIDEDTLWEWAGRNTPRRFPVIVKSLEDVLKDLLKKQMEKSGIRLNEEAWDKLLDSHRSQTKEKEFIQSKVYVLTNRYNTWGASAILYPEVLKTIAQKLGGDLLILPSSIHEVLFMRRENIPEYHVLAEVVKEVNKKEVLPEEVLSDSLYLYSGKDDSFCRVVDLSKA